MLLEAASRSRSWATGFVVPSGSPHCSGLAVSDAKYAKPKARQLFRILFVWTIKTNNRQHKITKSVKLRCILPPVTRQRLSQSTETYWTMISFSINISQGVVERRVQVPPWDSLTRIPPVVILMTFLCNIDKYYILKTPTAMRHACQWNMRFDKVRPLGLARKIKLIKTKRSRSRTSAINVTDPQPDLGFWSKIRFGVRLTQS